MNHYVLNGIKNDQKWLNVSSSRDIFLFYRTFPSFEHQGSLYREYNCKYTSSYGNGSLIFYIQVSKVKT